MRRWWHFRRGRSYRVDNIVVALSWWMDTRTWTPENGKQKMENSKFFDANKFGCLQHHNIRISWSTEKFFFQTHHCTPCLWGGLTKMKYCTRETVDISRVLRRSSSLWRNHLERKENFEMNERSRRLLLRGTWNRKCCHCTEQGRVLGIYLIYLGTHRKPLPYASGSTQGKAHQK